MIGPHGTGEGRNSGSHLTKAGVDLTQVPGQVAGSAEGHCPVLLFQEHLVYALLGPKDMSVLSGCLPNMKAVISVFL